MFFGHDYGWWGFWIGMPLALLSFLGMIFLWLFGDRLRERILNWWAKRSEASLRKRIEELEKLLARFERYELLTEWQDLALLGISLTLWLAVGGLAFSGFVLVTLLSALDTALPLDLLPVAAWLHLDPRAYLALGAAVFLQCAGVLLMLASFGFIKRLRAYRVPRSPLIRTNLRRDAEMLRSKLE
jgi:hypothetical protein